MKLFLDELSFETTVEITESDNARAVIIVAHGAGAGMHHPFMTDLASELSRAGIHAVRFNFPYMEEGRKSPGGPKKNIMAWKCLVDYIHSEFPDLPLFVAGKSYGGRMASHLLAEQSMSAVKGIIYFGFPLHAPGRDSKERASHLDQVVVPQLFLQGEKDKLANLTLIREVVSDLKDSVIIELKEADHSFNTPKKLGVSREDMIKALGTHTSKFIENISRSEQR